MFKFVKNKKTTKNYFRVKKFFEQNYFTLYIYIYNWIDKSFLHVIYYIVIKNYKIPQVLFINGLFINKLFVI